MFNCKFFLFFYFFIIQALCGVKEDSEFDVVDSYLGAALLKSKDVGTVNNYSPTWKMPDAPVCHPYNPNCDNRIICVRNDSFPKFLLNGLIREKMKAVGVSEADGFYLVIQISRPDLIIRPMYYFQNDTVPSGQKPDYLNSMSIEAVVYDPFNEITLKPDKSNSNFYSFSTHNIPEKSVQSILSSPNNMTLSGLATKNQCFLTFYKGVSQSIKNGTSQKQKKPKPPISTLHVLLTENDFNDLFGFITTKELKIYKLLEYIMRQKMDSAPMRYMANCLLSIFKPNAFGSSNTTFLMQPEAALPEGWRLWDGKSLLTSEHKPGANPNFTVQQTAPGVLKISGHKFNFHRVMPELIEYPDQKFTLHVDLKTTAQSAYIALAQDANVIESQKHSGSGNWETLELKGKINPTAKTITFYPAIVGSENAPDPRIEIGNIQFLFKWRKFDFASSQYLNTLFSISPQSALPQGWRLWDGKSLLTSEHKPGANPNFTVQQPAPGVLKISGHKFNFHRFMPELQQYQNEDFKIRADIRTNGTSAYIALAQDANVIESQKHSGSGNWETLELKGKINPTAKTITFYPAIVGNENIPDPGIEIRNISFLRK